MCRTCHLLISNFVELGSHIFLKINLVIIYFTKNVDVYKCILVLNDNSMLNFSKYAYINSLEALGTWKSAFNPFCYCMSGYIEQWT